MLQKQNRRGTLYFSLNTDCKERLKYNYYVFDASEGLDNPIHENFVGVVYPNIAGAPDMVSWGFVIANRIGNYYQTQIIITCDSNMYCRVFDGSAFTEWKEK